MSALVRKPGLNLGVNIVASKLNRSINDKLQYEYVKDDQHLRKPTQLDKSQLEKH